MNKTHLIEAVAVEAKISKVKALCAVDTVFSVIKRGVKAGDHVTLVGFGTFKLGEHRQRRGRNPRTGDDITIHAARVPKFRPGKGFKDEVK